MTNLLFLLFSVIFCNEIAYLTEETFEKESKFLIFHFLTKNGFECPLCSAIERKLPKLEFKTYKLDLFKQERLASRFFRFKYPSFTLFDSGKFYYLDVETFKELKNILENKSWTEHKQIYPFEWHVNLISTFLSPFLTLYDRFGVLFNNIPTWMYTIVLGALFLYLFFSILDIFTSKDEEKNSENIPKVNEKL